MEDRQELYAAIRRRKDDPTFAREFDEAAAGANRYDTWRHLVKRRREDPVFAARLNKVIAESRPILDALEAYDAGECHPVLDGAGHCPIHGDTLKRRRRPA